jgi:hypothetical protein
MQQQEIILAAEEEVTMVGLGLVMATGKVLVVHHLSRVWKTA